MDCDALFWRELHGCEMSSKKGRLRSVVQAVFPILDDNGCNSPMCNGFFAGLFVLKADGDCGIAGIHEVFIDGAFYAARHPWSDHEGAVISVHSPDLTTVELVDASDFGHHRKFLIDREEAWVLSPQAALCRHRERIAR